MTEIDGGARPLIHAIIAVILTLAFDSPAPAQAGDWRSAVTQRGNSRISQQIAIDGDVIRITQLDEDSPSQTIEVRTSELEYPEIGTQLESGVVALILTCNNRFPRCTHGSPGITLYFPSYVMAYDALNGLRDVIGPPSTSLAGAPDTHCQLLERMGQKCDRSAWENLTGGTSPSGATDRSSEKRRTKDGAEEAAEYKAVAIRVMRTVWPDLQIVEDHVTPDVAAYAMMASACLTDMNRAVAALGGAIIVPTSWSTIPRALIQMILGYLNGTDDWGLATRGGASRYLPALRGAMSLGPDVFPVDLNDTCKK